eukprot:3889334-Pleurochrysis_carterae.AAC.1
MACWSLEGDRVQRSGREPGAREGVLGDAAREDDWSGSGEAKGVGGSGGEGREGGRDGGEGGTEGAGAGTGVCGAGIVWNGYGMGGVLDGVGEGGEEGGSGGYGAGHGGEAGKGMKEADNGMDGVGRGVAGKEGEGEVERARSPSARGARQARTADDTFASFVHAATPDGRRAPDSGGQMRVSYAFCRFEMQRARAFADVDMRTASASNACCVHI